MSDDVLERIQYLNDCELTILSCLVAGEHAIITTTSSINLDAELLSTFQSTFGRDAALLRCDPDTTIDDLNNSVLFEHRRDTNNDEQQQERDAASFDDREVTSVIILSQLDLASNAVQVQVVDLLRTKRLYTHSAMHTAPKDFLIIITLSGPHAKLLYHLNDMIAVSHDYDHEDKRPDTSLFLSISSTEVDLLRAQALQARLTAEVDAYLYNIVLFMRMSRYVQGGISATATRQMRLLCKAFAALHSIDFVTPSIAMLAARKIYPHRIVLATATNEKSLQWGSEPTAVQKLLDDITISKVIEEVIASVETPL